MKSKATLLFILFLTLFLSAGCSRLGGEAEDLTAVAPTVTRLFQPVSTATAPTTGSSTVTNAPVPTDTPPPTTIVVDDQPLTESGELIIQSIETHQPGWIVIYNDDSGEAGEPIGQVQVSPEASENLVVTIDPLEASPMLFAIFHLDEGQIGTFEYPGPDRPAQSGTSLAAESFVVDIQIYHPGLSIDDQQVAEDGVVVIRQATAAEPSWIVIRADDEGEPGRMLAYAPLQVGINKDIALTINWRTAPPDLHAVLYVDRGNVGQFENPDVDQPIYLENEPVVASFEATYAPDIYVLDQPAATGEIVVERVISYTPSWLVVYNQNEDEALGNIIGWSPLEIGINSQVPVTVTETAITPVLYTILHEDLENIGEFEFPRTDPPMIYEDGLHTFSFRTDTGNYLITRDQSLTISNTVTVPLVVVDEDGWVVVRADEEGQLGEILGRRWVPAGVNREIAVTLNSELVTSTLHVVLHLDAGTSRVFDFPDGLDVPFQRNRSIIQAPFRLTENNG